MTHSDTHRNTATASVDTQAIQPGWTVYDSLERPVGNVTDFQAERLRVDGRPERRGQFEVPVGDIRRVEEGKVYLAREMDEITTPEPETMRSTMPDEDAMTATAFQATSPLGEAPSRPVSAAVRESADSAASWNRARTEDAKSTSYGGSSYTASGSPVGFGSNAPVGDEPGGYRSWESDIERSPWSRYAAWLAPIGIGAASAGAYAWWRKRQTRRGRLQQVTRALAAAGGSVTPVVEAARERKRAWWLAPLAALPLALYVRSLDGKSRLGEATSALPNGSITGRLPSVSLPAPGSIEPPPLWTLAVPILGAAAGAAWFAARGRWPARSGGTRSETRRLRDVMTRDVQVVRPEATVFEAASLMKRLDVGALPVCDGRRLQGMLTDRDVVVRSVADSRDPQLATAREAMTEEVIYAFEDDSVEKGAELMRKHRIRRLPIVSREKNLVGIVSLGDLAVDAGDDRMSGETLERVSEPAQPTR
jgi:CBS domain-containing protein